MSKSPAAALIAVVFACVLTVVGYGGYLAYERFQALEARVAAAEAAQKDAARILDSRMAEIAALLETKPDHTAEVQAIMEWIARAQIELSQYIMTFDSRDHQLLSFVNTLREAVNELKARVEVLEANQAQPPVAEPPQATPPPAAQPKAKKKKKKRAARRCNKPVTVCRGENPIVCEVVR